MGLCFLNRLTNRMYRIFPNFSAPLFFAIRPNRVWQYSVFDEISRSLIFSLGFDFSSAIRIEHVLSLNVLYTSDFVFFCHFATFTVLQRQCQSAAKALPALQKTGQILAIKQQIQSLTPSIMSYSPNSGSKKSTVSILASHWSMYA